MRPGIFAKTFAAESLEATLDQVVASGIRAIQFNLALTGGPTVPDDVPPGLRHRVADAAELRGLEIVAVSGTCNLAHPDRDVRRECLDALDVLIAAAPAMGTRVVTLCTGSRDPQDMWRWHPDNATPEAWADMATSVSSAARTAEGRDVVLAIEPELGNVVADAGDARRLLDEIGSPHLKIVIDAANLIRPGTLDRQEETMRQAFDLLGGDLVLAHAKDVRENGTVVAAGDGGIDYALYIRLLREAGYEGAVVLHGLRPEDVPSSVAFLERHLDDQAARVV